MDFIEQKYMYFYSNFIEICAWVELSSIDWGIGLVLRDDMPLPEPLVTDISDTIWCQKHINGPHFPCVKSLEYIDIVVVMIV